MTNFLNDNRIVLTLDAGGTNFVFSAIKSCEEIVENVCLSASANSLEEVLKKIIDGFEIVHERSGKKAVAISFAFPGPADYNNGIIGDLANLPQFRGGVALGPMLEKHFNLPVFINNDGDLFAYGEAIAGLLPEVNRALEAEGNPKRFKNLLGITLGTGFGGGIVCNGKLFSGDNSAQGEINRMRDSSLPNSSAEETISIRGIKRLYKKYAGIYDCQCPEPVGIFAIATGKIEGNQQAAINAFEEFAKTIAHTVCDAITMIDGLVVIGGGLSGAAPLFMTTLVEEMRKPYETVDGDPLTRLEIDVFNFEDEKEKLEFLKGDVRTIKIPFSDEEIKYDAAQRIGVGVSRLGTSKSVAIGAYAFALNSLA